MSTPHFDVTEYLDLKETDHAAIFHGVASPWEILPKLIHYLETNLVPANFGRPIGSPVIGKQVYIGKNTTIEPGAYIKGPAWIGPNCQIRHGAYIRENVIVGAGCVIGNSTEIKNSFLLNGVQAPHFNYIGDSILGAKVHLAAGVIISNLKLSGDFIMIRSGESIVTTGLRKFGALIGDHVEIGCNAVLNPGTVIGRRSLIYPGVSWRGVLPADSIAKTAETVHERQK